MRHFALFKTPAPYLTTSYFRFSLALPCFLGYPQSVEINLNKEIKAMSSPSGLLRLPPELLLLIADYTVEANSEKNQRYTVFNSSRGEALIALSRVNKTLRNACTVAGLFSCLSPKAGYKTREKSPFIGVRLDHWGPLTCLGIDLSEERVWSLCANIMNKYPNLEELCLRGDIGGRVRAFESSKLRKSLALFRGTALILRNANFDKNSLFVLESVAGPSITSLYFDRSALQSNMSDFARRVPLLPNLKKVKYIGRGDLSTRGRYRADTIDNFCTLYLRHVKISHFEISYGIRPCCLKGDRDELLLGLNANMAYRSMRRQVLNVLRDSSRASLEVYIDDNELSGAFTEDDQIFCYRNDIPPPPFRKTTILVFRCERLEDLSDFDHPGSDLVCSLNLPPKFVTRHRQYWSQHHHSIWKQLSYEYAFFSECDCVLLETTSKEQSHAIPEYLCKQAFQRLMATAEELEGRRGRLRFFIVGNNSAGFVGIERQMKKSPAANDDGELKWDNRMLTSMQCRDLLRRRCHDL